MKTINVSLLAVLCAASVGQGQTATPTATQGATPAATATQSTTSTPAALAPSASAAAASAPAITVPVPLAGVFYRYWPRVFYQWVGTELPYSMIEFDVDDRGSKPVYDAVLTDRATNKRVHYTNTPMQAMIDRAAGAEVHEVAMQLDAPPEAVKGATYLLRFVTENGTPVSWQFIQGSDITEQGGGITPVNLPTPMLLYREQGAVAGEGTAVKVGNITSTADMWKEISQPPYFIAYHGALSQDVHEVVLVPRTVEWKVEPPTAAVAAGAVWTLTNPTGAAIAVHVDSVANGLATLRETNAALGTAVLIDARQTPTGWSIEKVRYVPAGSKGEHAISFTFNPPVTDAGTSKLEIRAGKKTKLAEGTVTTSAGGVESWVLTQPEWAHKDPVTATATQTR